MNAAVILAPGQTPLYREFRDPEPTTGTQVLQVLASALSTFSKSRSSGRHYSAVDTFPAVAGAEGVGRTADGQRLYFALPEAPFGALADQTLVRAEHCVAVPDSLGDVVAAALANPGMSAWTALVERAHLQLGETVLINGATGAAGRLAVKLARFLGAGRVIATGRNEAALLSLGADEAIVFDLTNGAGMERFTAALNVTVMHGVDVVIDYLWGRSALAILGAIARGAEDGHPVRFVQVGEASGEHEISLPGAALRSSAIQLMGSGIKSVPLPRLLEAVRQVFKAAGPAGLSVETRTIALSEVEQTWDGASGTPRVVYLPASTATG